MSSAAAMENPPRQSTSDNIQSGPIPLFDQELRLITDSYLPFFQERKRIEETYVESLSKLHQSAKVIDTQTKEASTTRIAWSEVKDNIDRESQVRHAFLSTLTVDVINPLIFIKETQDRTRQRISEGVKESTIAYNEYAENILPRLKRTYLKKCQDVEDHKAAAATAMLPPQSPIPMQDHHPLTNSRSNPTIPARPVVTAPQPLKPLERRPSVGMPGNRNRPPPNPTAFSDLAHQGKRQLNQLIGFLDKGGSVKDGLGVRSENSSLRAVRAKREADEADKEYRKGVHWLETLRLRRTKILEGGYKSLEMFIYESALTVKKVLEKYTDNMTATTTTLTQLAGHARSAVSKISPQKDITGFASYSKRSLALSIPKPVLYHNHNVGECNDLIFGVNLVDYATARALLDGEIPKIVRICIKEIDQRGLESEGIYRVSGRHAIVQSLQHKIERDERAFEFTPPTDDVYAVASLLKLYLRELPEPVFKYPLQDRIQYTEDRADHQSNNFMLLRAKMRRLPAVHQATLKAIVEHLARVVALSEKNKMGPKNLAIVFGGVIFGEDEIPKGGDLLSVQAWKDCLMEDLITNAHMLFDAHHYPPLPPIPAGEPIPSYVYGTSHTKIASVPPSPRLTRMSPPEDFTPRLPPRPTNSIHPSSRAQVAPPKERGDVQHLQLQPAYDDLPPSPLTASTMIDNKDEMEASTSEAESSLEMPTIPTSLRPSSRSSRMSKLPLEPLPNEHGCQQTSDLSSSPPS